MKIGISNEKDEMIGKGYREDSDAERRCGSAVSRYSGRVATGWR